MGWPRLKCLGLGSGHPTSFPFLLCATKSTSSAHHTSPSTRSTFSRAMLNPAPAARIPLTSHNFHLLAAFQALLHLCAPWNTHPLLNAKPSARSISHRSSSADAISLLCDTLPLRLYALNVDCADVQHYFSEVYYE